MQLYDRGAIREGLQADVTIFNEDRLADVATYAAPTTYPLGID
jgi:N-acyl-D-amino-acid deacylase